MNKPKPVMENVPPLLDGEGNPRTRFDHTDAEHKSHVQDIIDAVGPTNPGVDFTGRITDNGAVVITGTLKRDYYTEAHDRALRGEDL